MKTCQHYDGIKCSIERLRKIWERGKDTIDKYVVVIFVVSMLARAFFSAIIPSSVTSNLALASSGYVIMRLFMLLIDITKVIDELKWKKDIGKFEDVLNNAVSYSLNNDNDYSIDIFAYTAKNYLAHLSPVISNGCIGNAIAGDGKITMRLLLCRINDYQPDQERYAQELKHVLYSLNALKKKFKDEKFQYEVRFIDDRRISHFCILGKKVVMVGVLPKLSNGSVDKEPKTHKSECYTISDESIVAGYEKAFNTWFEDAYYDSGLKILDDRCAACKEIVKPKSNSYGCSQNNESDFKKFINTPLLGEIKGLDFYVLPDSRPISKLHIILMCKYHVLNLFDYLKHRYLMMPCNTEDGRRSLNPTDALDSLIRCIRNAIRRITNGEDVLVFEHGSLNPHSGKDNKATSIDHLHLHMILKPQSFKDSSDGDNIIQLIEDDCRSQLGNYSPTVVECDEQGEQLRIKYERYDSLGEFGGSSVMGMQDYFMIWDLGKEKDGIYVFFKNENANPGSTHQYLRRLFFNKLEEWDKATLYPMIKDDKDEMTKIWQNNRQKLKERGVNDSYRKLCVALQKELSSVNRIV